MKTITTGEDLLIPCQEVTNHPPRASLGRSRTIVGMGGSAVVDRPAFRLLIG
jgi:hypothetical protein